MVYVIPAGGGGVGPVGPPGPAGNAFVVGAVLASSGNQTIIPGGIGYEGDQLELGTVISDPNGWDSTHSITPTESGTFVVVGVITFSTGGAAMQARARIAVNGTAVEEEGRVTPAGVLTPVSYRVSTTLQLSAGDVVSLVADPEVNVNTVGNFTQASGTWLGVYRIA